MNIVKRILQALLLLVLVLALIAVFLPAKARVARDTTINAPPDGVFALLDGFERYNEFSPWYEYDPQATYTRSGPATGVGAKLSWDSQHPNVGKGSQELIAVDPGKSVTSRLDFGSPGTNTGIWTLVPADSGTRVTWAIESDAGWNLVGRWFGLFLENFVGKDFERGLVKLKAVAEADAAKPKPPTASIEIIDAMAPMDIAFVAARSEMDVAKINALLGTIYARTGEFLKSNGLEPAGPVGAVNRALSATEWVFDGFTPYAGSDEAKAKAVAAAATLTGEDAIRLGQTQGGRMVKAVHVGPYEATMQTYERVARFLADNRLEAAGPSFEQYLNDPAQTPPEQLVTHVFQPIK